MVAGGGAGAGAAVLDCQLPPLPAELLVLPRFLRGLLLLPSLLRFLQFALGGGHLQVGLLRLFERSLARFLVNPVLLLPLHVELLLELLRLAEVDLNFSSLLVFFSLAD